MLCGIFAGGSARRMGGCAKGLLSAPDGQPVVVRLAGVARSVGLEPVWVGLSTSAHASAYRAALALPELDDDPAGIGPLGGLAALLARGDAIALACDLPFVSAPLLQRLAQQATPSWVLAPRSQTGLWEPLFARYDARVAAPLAHAITAGTRSFQQLFATLSVQELPLDTGERTQLVDWDTPADIVR